MFYSHPSEIGCIVRNLFLVKDVDIPRTLLASTPSSLQLDFIPSSQVAHLITIYPNIVASVSN
jgi:hypothetical protein